MPLYVCTTTPYINVEKKNQRHFNKAMFNAKELVFAHNTHLLQLTLVCTLYIHYVGTSNLHFKDVFVDEGVTSDVVSKCII